MNEKLIDSIASDLGILRYKNSLTDDEYACFVTYSAAVLWAKTATQDDPEEDEDLCRRTHISHVCNDFINEIIENSSSELHLHEYFITSESDFTPGKKLLNRLISVHELNEFGFENIRFVALCNPVCKQISNDFQINKGMLRFMGNDKMVSGLSVLEKNPDDVKNEFISNSQYVSGLLKKLKHVKPVRTVESKDDCYFNPYFDVNMEFNGRKPVADMPFQLVKNHANYTREYFIRTKDGFYKFDETEIELKEHYRFMMFLLSYVKKNVARLSDDGHIMKLNLNSSLPMREELLLYEVLWPKRNIDDAGSFVGPSFLKSYVIRILESLGIAII